MNRILAIILILSVFLTFTGCRTKTNEPLNTVTVYYKTSVVSYGTASGVIVPYELDATNHEGDIIYLLNYYLANLPSEAYAVTFPKDTRIVSLDRDGLTAKIVLNDAFAELTDLNLSIACACLTQTVISLTDCQEVILSAENAKLDGQNYITLSRDGYLLIDESGTD